MQLFFGYVENYSFYAVGLAVFLWLCLRCLRGACTLLWPGLALYLCVALHLSAAVLALPFLVLLAVLLADPARRRATLRGLGVLALAAGVALFILIRRGFNPIDTMLGMVQTAFTDKRNAGYMFSTRHYRDFLNEQILVGPLGIFLFACALVTIAGSGARRSARQVFLVVAGASFVLATWPLGDSNLGYARDWDLLSHTGMVFTTAGLGLFLVRRTSYATVVAGLIIAFSMSLYHTVPWIATNANETRSLARLQTLPLGYGRTEVLVAGWYERHGDPDHAREWLERSIAAYPGNPNSYYEIGAMNLATHDYTNAAMAFENSVRCRPDRLPYRLATARAWFCAGQPAHAVPHLEAILQQYPDNMSAVVYMGEALYQSGRTADAAKQFERARRSCRAMTRHQPPNALEWATYGWTLYRTGAVDSSLTVLTRAVDIDPSNAEAQCYLGCVLRSVGRNDEARDHFMTSQKTNPDLPAELPDRSAILAWLGSPE
jgi:tetratricopeptide (TPR) repeat protein